MLTGCNLSPLLFSLYISSLGQKLNSSGLGINLGPQNISSIFFADDLVIVAKNKDSLNTLLGIARTYFHSHRLQISSTKTKIMTYDAQTDKVSFEGSDVLSPVSFDAVLSFKYLGVPFCSSPYNLFKSFNEQVKRKAKQYLSSVLAIVRTGPDRSKLAHTLWTQVALPSILYGAEVMPLNQGTINEVERCQTLVGKFILQLPRNSANVCSYLDAGLRPIWAEVAKKVLKFSSSTMNRSPSYWPKVAMNEHIAMGANSMYLRYLLKWKSATNSYCLQSKQLNSCIDNAAIAQILKDQKIASSTTFAMNSPEKSSKRDWFSPKPWVNDSYFSKIIAEFRACNIGLGNRGPTKTGEFFKLCPLCAKVNVKAINNEVHMLICCPQMSFYRDSCILGSFISSYRKVHPSISALKLFALFLNDRVPGSMKKKAFALHHMKSGWFTLMKIPL